MSRTIKTPIFVISCFAIAVTSFFLIFWNIEQSVLVVNDPLLTLNDNSDLEINKVTDFFDDLETSFVPARSVAIPADEISIEDGQRDDIFETLLYLKRLKKVLQSNKNPITSESDWFHDDHGTIIKDNFANFNPHDRRSDMNGRFRRDTDDNVDNNDKICSEENGCHVVEELSSSLQSFWRYTGDPDRVREHQGRVMKRNMDTSVDPCTDFYQYACGNWETLNPIPSDKAGFDTFEMLRENLDQVLRDLLTSEKVKQWENLPFLPDNTVVKKYLQMEPLKIIAVLEHLEEDDDLHYASMEEMEVTQADRRKRNLKNNTQEIEYVDLFTRSKRNIVTTAEDLLFQNSKINLINGRFRRLKKSVKSVDLQDDNNINVIGGKSTMSDDKTNEETNDDSKPLSENGESVDAITKAKHFYESCMNYDILEKREHQPLLDLLKKLGGWPMLDPEWNETEFDWVKLIGILRLFNNDILLSERVAPDIRKSDEFVVQLDQSGLGLPTPEYFLLETNKEFLEAYKQYMTSVSILLGVEPVVATKSVGEIIHFEKKLAKLIIPPENRRNISELYQRLSVRELSKTVPKIKWKRYLSIVLNRTVAGNESVVMYATKYAKDLSELIEVTPPRTVANYILWRFIRHRVNSLDDKFQEPKQKFFNKLFGRETSPPRWKNCVSQINSNMGMVLGSMFVAKYFDENSKNDTLVMTREIQQSFKELLNITSWIDEETKTLATDKVDAMTLRIGYPDCVLNQELLDKKYEDLTIHPEMYFENTLNILRHLTKTEHSKLGQTVNKTQWNTAPAVVNAFYSRNKNQILFPAGILQPPFYHKHFPKCLNYGGIGVVIGHEITHGFDDKGRLFDKQGNLQRWWPEGAIHLFHKKAQCIIDQYSEYQVSEVSMPLDGVTTQGENIADNGGIKQAFRAYKHWIKQNDDIQETLPGINATSEQLFFINFAQIWCGAMRPEAMKNKLKVAVHSPGRFRVIGTVSNSHDFAEAFQCPLGSPMNPHNKCDVW